MAAVWRWLALAIVLVATTASAAPAKPQLTKEPKLVQFVPAEVPDAERAAGKTATVVLRIVIDATGKVTGADVTESAGATLDAAARDAVMKFVFEPAEIDGKPAPIRIVYRYEFDLSPPAPPTAALGGVVRRRGKKEPLADVTVELVVVGEDGPRTVTTDAAGKFAFDDVPPGEVTIRLSGAKITAVQTTETLEGGQALEVAYDVSLAPPPSEEGSDDLEIVVVAPALQREVVSTRIKADDARRVPGTSGDVVRVVESLPGVARSAAGSGQLVVWGSSPQDTRVYMDGVPIPRMYHEGGLRSVVHPKLVDSISLVPGGYGAQWGRGVGGMVSIESRTPERERVSGRLHADILDASAVVATPIGKKKNVHFAIAARGSYVALWTKAILDDDATEFVPIPTYADGQMRVLWRPSARDRVEFVAMASSDRFSRGVPNADPALATREKRALDFQRLYARWTRERGHRRLDVTPFVGYSRSRLTNAYGPIETSLGSDTVIAGVRANYSIRPKKWVRIDAGVDAEVDVYDLERVGSLGLPAREGDVRVFGQPPPQRIGADDWRVVTVGIAPYVEAELAPLDGKLRIVPGLRLDPYGRSVSRRNPPQSGAPAVGLFEQDFAAEPRLAVIAQPIDRLQFKAATGLYRQQPAPEDLSASFGNPYLPSAKAVHAVLGGTVKIVPTLSLEVTGFYTQSKRLAMRSNAASPLPAEALVPSGQGRAWGMQVLLKQDLWKGLFGWVSYTIMQSQRKNRDTSPWRLFDFDQMHVLTAVLGYMMPKGFEGSARFRFASGFPRTPVTGAYVYGGYQPIFGTQNSVRIPPFVQLDLRFAKRFDIKGTTLEVFLEVLNLWNRKNAEEIVYSTDFTRKDYIRGFPILPVLGLQWDF